MKDDLEFHLCFPYLNFLGGSQKTPCKIYNVPSCVIFSIGVSDRRLLCVVRLEVLQEKAAKGQEERKRWERKGDGRNIRKYLFSLFLTTISVF